jgi:NAD(P)-dependent dehydrogenase (short-subunit alcohol dehydrogenase family)
MPYGSSGWTSLRERVVSPASPAPTPRRLEGQVAIVTGSTGLGTGTEIARVLAAEGAGVVVTGRSAEHGARITDEISSAGGSAICVPADLGVEKECAELVAATVEHFGGLSVLVHSAVATLGTQHLAATEGAGEGPIGDVTDSTWDRQILVQLTSFMWLCRHAIPHLRRGGGGSIVIVGSRVAERGTPDRAGYTATKGALHALARSIAVDYAQDHIRCNTVAVGYIVDKERETPPPPEVQAWIDGMHLTRPPTVTDVARSVAFLASDDAGAITGHTLMLDGGNSAARAQVVG